jgi:hypothetical protein
MSNVKIGVEAKLDSADLDKTLAEFQQKVNRVGAAIAAANKVQFNPISKATLADLDRIAKNFEELKRGSPNLSAAIGKSGQGSKSFFDLDFGKLFSSSIAREAARYGTFSRVTQGTGAGFVQAASPSPSQGGNSGHGGGGGYRQSSPGASWGWRGFGRQALGAGLRGAGSGGAAVDGALSAGSGAMSAGVGAAAGMFVGTLAVAGIKAIMSAVAAQVGNAQQENIGIDTLKRSLGDTNVSFDALKASLRGTAGAIGETYNETVKLGQSFAKLGNVSEKNYGDLAESVQFAGGFGRSFGMDPAQSVGMFGTLQGVGVTRNTADMQRVGVIIGETITKSGAFAQSDRILQAIAGFATQQTRMGLTPANIAGYGGALASMVGSGIPGLDVQGSAGILDRMNGAIASGGGAGQAGQNFLYSAIGRRLGLDPFQTTLLQEQGAFGTGAAEFGKGSPFEQWAKDNGVTVPGMAAGSTSTNLGLIMAQLRKSYSGGGVMSEMRVNAEANLLGLNNSQAMSVDMMFSRGGPQRVDSTLKRLQRLGLSLSSVNSTGISGLTQVDADKGLTDQQKDDQFKTIAGKNQESTPGTDIRDAMVGTQNALQDYAGRALPLLTTSADALLALVGKSSGHMMTAAELHDVVLSGQRKTVNDRANARISAAQHGLTNASSVDDYGRVLDPAAQRAAYGNLQSETAAANDDRATGMAQVSAGDLGISPTLAKRAGQAAVDAAIADQKKYGVPAAVSQLLLGPVSSFRPEQSEHGQHACGRKSGVEQWHRQHGYVFELGRAVLRHPIKRGRHHDRGAGDYVLRQWEVGGGERDAGRQSVRLDSE